MVRISAGSFQDLKNWNLLQSGQALGIMTVAGNFSNADAIFVGVRSCCLLPSYRNNLVEDQVCAVEKWAILFNTVNKSLLGRSSMPLKGQFLCCAVTFVCTRNCVVCSRVFVVLIAAKATAWAIYVTQVTKHTSHLCSSS